MPGGGSDGEERPPLDEAALQACSIYQPAHDEVRSGRLTGPPLFRVLQDVFNAARLSGTPGFSGQVQELYTTAIGVSEAPAQQPMLVTRADALQSRCAED